jgi:hypothetical protein
VGAEKKDGALGVAVGSGVANILRPVEVFVTRTVMGVG